MYKDHVVVCVIPARGGSKGLPGKNTKMFCGKPLIARTIEHARHAKYIDRVIVSTEDDQIAEISLANGAEVPFRRPKELATDKVATMDVLLHAVKWLEEKEKYRFDILVLLHATNPLRRIADINECIELLVEGNADNVFSVTGAHSNPYFNMVEVNENGYVTLSKRGKFTARQDAPLVYEMNSSVYVWWTKLLKKKKGIFLKRSKIFIMPRERSIDIDDSLDFRIAEMLYENSSE